MHGRRSPYRRYKVTIVILDSCEDTDQIAEDIEFSLGGYDIEALDIYEIG